MSVTILVFYFSKKAKSINFNCNLKIQYNIFFLEKITADFSDHAINKVLNNSAVRSIFVLGGLKFSDTARANHGLARGGEFENSQF